MKHIFFAGLSLCVSISVFATIVHQDHVYVHVSGVHVVGPIPAKLKIEYGHIKNNQCVYDMYEQQTQIVPLKANKLMTFSTKDTDISGDVGRGYTCMRYTLSLKGHQYTQKATDPFIIQLDQHGNYVSSLPFSKRIDLLG